MVMKKITTNNSLRFVPKIEQTREIKQNTMKNNSLLKEPGKGISQN